MAAPHNQEQATDNVEAIRSYLYSPRPLNELEQEVDREMTNFSELTEDAQKAMRVMLLGAKARAEREKFQSTLDGFEKLAKGRIKFYENIEFIIKLLIFIGISLGVWGFFDPSESRASLAFTLLIANIGVMLMVGFLAWVVSYRDSKRESAK